MINSRLIKSNDAGGGVCTSDITDIFGDSSGIALYQLNWDGSDMSGNYDGVATDVSFVNGHIDSAGSFNGSSSYINTPNVIKDLASDNFSISMWVNVTIIPATGERYFYCNMSNSASRLIYLKLSSNGTVALDCQNGASQSISTSTTALALGTWYHILGTYSTSLGGKIYVNSVLENTSAYITLDRAAHTFTDIGKFAIGLGGYVNSEIDQVRIFNKAISAAEVSTLYAEAACEKTCTTDTPQLVPNCIAYYKLDGNATDSNGSGTLYDGTATNVNWTQGRFGSAGGFNGSTSKITISSMSSLGISDVRAVSGWIKTTTTAAGNMFSIGKTGSSSGYAWFQVTIESDGKLSGGYTWSNGGTKNGKKTSIVVNDGNWHNIVFVTSGDYANGGGAFYIDGQEDTNSTLFNTANGGQSTITGIATIGTYSGQSASFFNGSIDQVKIFDRAITAAEVTTLYNEVQCPSNASFNTVLYEGDNSTSRNIGGAGFQPDMVWVKNRDSSGENHALADTVRGNGEIIYPNLTNATNGFTYLTPVNEGFDITTNNNNAANNSYVAWCWKTGGAAVTNTDGSITSEVSANVDAGFSVVKYTGNSSASGTIGHALTAAPNIIIVKNLDNGSALWSVYSSAVGASQVGHLNSTAAFSSSGDWFSTTPTSSVFSVGSSGSGRTNSTAQNHIAYCFHSVVGFSKFGSYIGTGTSNDIDLGFNLGWIMIKNASHTNHSWNIVDTTRNTGSNLDLYLQADNNGSEASTTICSLITNGFNVSGSQGFNNANGDTYIYMAFANQF